MKGIIDINNETNKKLVFGIKTNSKTPIKIKVQDMYKPNTVYTYNWGFVNGERTFYVRMPRTPTTLIYDIYNPQVGNKKEGEDKTFSVTKKDVVSLKTYPSAYLTASPKKNAIIKSALKFIQDFSERAGVLSAGGSVYRSADGMFRIDYVDAIIEMNPASPMYGRELTTPARISVDRGVIQVSKKYFLPYSIPYRVAILLHEISHYYLNKESSSEIEADEHAIDIFLGSGYGPTDGADAFLNVFDNSPSDQNKERTQILIKRILDFDKKYNIAA